MARKKKETIVKTDVKDFSKNLETGLVVNTNKTGLQAAKERKRKLLDKDKKLEILENEVSELKKMVEDLLKAK